MLEGHDGSAVGTGALADTQGPHGLLLSLAGLIDDELLGWCRELAAVGESDYALELVTAAIAADNVRVPEAVHAGLLRSGKGQGGLELPAPDPAPVMAHRFLADPAAVGYPPTAGRSPADVLHTLPARLVRGCRLWLTWRLTPAGSAPTPVPHPVLLVETSDGGGADLLAYQVADLLWQAGVFASVEVFGAGADLDEYHRAALAASTPLETDGVVGTAPPQGGQQPSGLPAPVAAGLVQRGDPSQTSPRGNPSQASPRGNLPARESFGRDHSDTRDPRPPLHPVDRVIAARASAPRNPIDNVMPFERGPADRPGQDRPPQDRPGQNRAAGLFDDARDPGVDSRPPREQRWNPGNDQRTQARDESARQPDMNFGRGDWPGSSPAGQPPVGQPPAGPASSALPDRRPGSGPELNGAMSNGLAPNGSAPNGPAPNGTTPNGSAPNGAGPVANGAGPGLNGAGPNGAGPGSNSAGPGHKGPGPVNGVERNGAPGPRNGVGPDRSGGPGPRTGVSGTSATSAVPPANQPPMGPPPGRPPMGNPQPMAGPTGRQQPVKPPQGPPPGPPPPQGRPPAQPPRTQAPPPPKRPPLRPAELPELPDGLSDVEQKLLRQLHEELAQREDNGLPPADQPPQRMFRNTNGGGRPPQRPMGPSEGN